MKNILKISGWQIKHQEKLIYQANKGTPIITLKFFNYPNYHQNVQIDKLPAECKLKNKEFNSYFVFQHKVGTKGTISLERIISVVPITYSANLNNNWGLISDFPKVLKEKYKQNLKYWPIKSESIYSISKQEWFRENDLFNWVHLASYKIKDILKYREKQEKRLGADQAIQMSIGDCDEFTDLFITFSRVRGIPCRRLTGYFIRNNGTSSEGHAWGEIFSQRIGWIPVDLALNNIGYHTTNYIILKIEEFNSTLSDYQIRIKHTSTVHYKWVFPDPIFTPIFY